MEPMDIDWKNIDSRFILDELYEHIQAPKWIDLSAPDSSSSLIDDDAWFCRPDCKHPKSADDFKVKIARLENDSKIMQLGERNQRDTANLKRRGILSSFHGARADIPRSMRTPKKKFQDESENRNPNYSTIPDPDKAFKASIKSSAEKKPSTVKKTSGSSHLVEGSPHTEQILPQPNLKSTLSARSLFTGKEILSQIVEFCNELKKLAVTAGERENSARTEAEEKEEAPQLEEARPMSGTGECVLEEKRVVSGKEKAERTMNSKFFNPDSWKKKKRPAGLENIQATAPDLNGGSDRDKSFSPQVRSCPPTPQRFLSPSNQGRSARITPLKPSKSRTAERGILQEVVQTEKTMKNSSVVEDENQNLLVSGTEEARSVDMFWFLKPCAYLVK